MGWKNYAYHILSFYNNRAFHYSVVRLGFFWVFFLIKCSSICSVKVLSFSDIMRVMFRNNEISPKIVETKMDRHLENYKIIAFSLRKVQIPTDLGIQFCRALLSSFHIFSTFVSRGAFGKKTNEMLRLKGSSSK